MRPIDGDALIKETTEARCFNCDRRKGMKNGKMTFVYEIGDAPCRACDVMDMIDALDEAPTVATDTNVLGKWISVKDRMPEQAGYRCLVSAEYGDGKRTVFTAYTGYGEPGWWTYDITHMERAMYADNHVHHNYHITHWMLLPEPPKEGNVSE